MAEENKNITIRGIRYPIPSEKHSDVWVNGNKLDIEKSLKVQDHSPTGFEWGYWGSGPSQLALAICMEFMPVEEALNRYQKFKQEVIGKIDKKLNDFSIKIPIKAITG